MKVKIPGDQFLMGTAVEAAGSSKRLIGRRFGTKSDLEG